METMYQNQAYMQPMQHGMQRECEGRQQQVMFFMVPVKMAPSAAGNASAMGAGSWQPQPLPGTLNSVEHGGGYVESYWGQQPAQNQQLGMNGGAASNSNGMEGRRAPQSLNQWGHGGSREQAGWGFQQTAGLGQSPTSGGSSGVQAEFGAKLCRAADEGRVAAIKALVQVGADIEANAGNGITALMYASNHGHLQAVKFLVEAGADIQAKNGNGETALMFASASGNVEAVKFLVEDLTASKERHWSGLLSGGFQAGADSEATDRQGWTVLLNASYYGHVEAVKALVEARAELNAGDHKGWTALKFAEDHAFAKRNPAKYQPIAEYLRCRGATK